MIHMKGQNLFSLKNNNNKKSVSSASDTLRVKFDDHLTVLLTIELWSTSEAQS